MDDRDSSIFEAEKVIEQIEEQEVKKSALSALASNVANFFKKKDSEYNPTEDSMLALKNDQNGPSAMSISSIIRNSIYRRKNSDESAIDYH